MKKNQNGITLIALVITIIVLLILAGVSIAMLTGENGILKQAVRAGDETKLAEQKEQVTIAINALTSEFYEKKYVEQNTTISSTGLGSYVLTGLGSYPGLSSFVDVDTTAKTVTTKATDENGKKAIATYDTSTATLGAWTPEA